MKVLLWGLLKYGVVAILLGGTSLPASKRHLVFASFVQTVQMVRMALNARNHHILYFEFPVALPPLAYTVLGRHPPT